MFRKQPPAHNEYTSPINILRTKVDPINILNKLRGRLTRKPTGAWLPQLIGVANEYMGQTFRWSPC